MSITYYSLLKNIFALSESKIGAIASNNAARERSRSTSISYTQRT